MFHISIYIKWQLYGSPQSQLQREASWLSPHGRAHSFAICHQNLAGLICASCRCSNSQDPMLLPINDRMKYYTADEQRQKRKALLHFYVHLITLMFCVCLNNVKGALIMWELQRITHPTLQLQRFLASSRSFVLVLSQQLYCTVESKQLC